MKVATKVAIMKVVPAIELIKVAPEVGIMKVKVVPEIELMNVAPEEVIMKIIPDIELKTVVPEVGIMKVVLLQAVFSHIQQGAHRQVTKCKGLALQQLQPGQKLLGKSAKIKLRSFIIYSSRVLCLSYSCHIPVCRCCGTLSYSL
jgi:hypothetical protein